jgi:hypothetical protein
MVCPLLLPSRFDTPWSFPLSPPPTSLFSPLFPVAGSRASSYRNSEQRLTCRAPRATWVQTELFLTFPTPLLRSITLQPLTSPETGGRFRVWIYLGDRVELVWDRKVSPASRFSCLDHTLILSRNLRRNPVLGGTIISLTSRRREGSQN